MRCLFKSLVLGLAAGALFAVSTATTARADGLDHFKVVDCDPAFADKVWTSLHYIETALNTGIEFHRCAHNAIREVHPLVTRQELTAVGPYVPCQATAPQLREPPEVYTNPTVGGGRAVGYLMRTFSADYGGTITLRCTFLEDTARNVTRFATAGDEGSYTIELGNKTWTTRPGHQPKGGLPDMGPTFNHAGLEPSYQVDELAGIIVHEILHAHQFEHGSAANNECRYTSYNCDASVAGRSCRANSINEIMEACMSEVVEQSVAQCGWNMLPVNGDDHGLVRHTPVVYGYDSSCHSAGLSAPRDRSSWVQPELEQDVDRPGSDYYWFANDSAIMCRVVCLVDARCHAFTQAGGTCWLKNAIPAPRPGTGMASGVVRVGHPFYWSDTIGAGIKGWFLDYHVGRTGTPFLTLPAGGDLGDCLFACRNDVNCGSATYDTRSGACTLRDPASLTAFTYDPGLVTYRPDPDPSDPGDTFAWARAVGYPFTDLAVGIRTSTDVDYFRFKVSSEREVRMSINFTHAYGDLDIELLDSHGTTLASSTGTTDLEELVRRLAAGEYVLKVYGYRGATNQYRVRVRDAYFDFDFDPSSWRPLP